VQGISISNDEEPNWIKILTEYLIQNDEGGLHNLIASTYPDFDTKYDDWSYLSERGILARQQMMMLMKSTQSCCLCSLAKSKAI